MEIIEGMNFLGVPASIIAVIVGVIIVAELMKSTSDLFSFIADRYLGFKTQYTKKKEREALVYKNREDLERFVKDQVQFNFDMKKELNDIHDTMKDVSDSVVQLRVSEMRSKILDFASAVSNGRIYTREQFNYIKKLYEQYEAEIHKRGMHNDEVSLSMEIINSVYADRLRKKSFIEDRISDPIFQEKVRQILENQTASLDHDD